MTSTKIYPSQETPNEHSPYVELIICNSLDQMGEWAPDFQFKDGDHSLFIPNESPDIKEFSKIGTMLFLKDHLEYSIIVYMCTMAAMRYSEMMLTLLDEEFDNNETKVTFFHTQTALVSQILFSHTQDFLKEKFEEFILD